MTPGVALQVVVYYSVEDGAYLARCLDFDLLGHGETPQAAVECLQGAVATYLEFTRRHGTQPFQRAPEASWEMFRRAAVQRLWGEQPSPGSPLPYSLAVAL